MKIQTLLLPVAALVVTSLAIAADDDNPIKKAMQSAHKAPQGEKKICEKIVAGNATDAEVQTALKAYKAMADTKPPRSDQAEFKVKVARLITATEDVAAKKEGAAAGYKEAVNCKACHSEHKPEDKK